MLNHFLFLLKVMSVTLDDFKDLSERARNDLSLNKTDTTMLKYIQGQVKDQVQQPGNDEVLKVYAENNLFLLQHIYTQLKSNIEFKRTKTLPLKEVNELSQTVAQLPGSLGHNTLPIAHRDKMFVNMTNLILNLLRTEELTTEQKHTLYSSLFRMASTHKDYLSRHQKVDRVIKAKIKELSFSENEKERMLGKMWFQI